MNIEKTVELVQRLVVEKTNQPLGHLQTAILQGTLENKTYEHIAEIHCFSSAHAKAVGATLWNLLSQVFATKVNKRTIHRVLYQHEQREKQQLNTPQEPCSHRQFPEPELPGGQVPLDSPFYIERPPLEERAYKAILQPGALIRIHAARQMGKTSLLARILHEAKWQGYRTVTLSFQLAHPSVFTNWDKCLQWFCASVSKSLGLPNQILECWDEVLGSNYSSTDYFERYILAQIDTPIVLGLDNTDMLFQEPDIGLNFFELLRTWYEKAKYADSSSQQWQKLRLVIVHSTDIYGLLNLHQTFNVGLPLELSEFSSEQIQQLAQCHGFAWEADQVKQLMSLVGGCPYPVRKALYHIWYRDLTLEQLLPTANSHLNHPCQSMVQTQVLWHDD